MILVDTSVWVDHLQRGNAALAERLVQGQVLGHPFVLGELALGSLKQRANILQSLQNLPAATVATDTEVLSFITTHSLHGIGIGIGYVDAHLLAAVKLTPGSQLWTLDKRLLAAAGSLRLAFSPAD